MFHTVLMTVVDTRCLDVALTKLAAGECVRYCGPDQGLFFLEALKLAQKPPFRVVFRTAGTVTVWAIAGSVPRPGDVR